MLSPARSLSVGAGRRGGAGAGGAGPAGPPPPPSPAGPPPPGPPGPPAPPRQRVIHSCWALPASIRRPRRRRVPRRGR